MAGLTALGSLLWRAVAWVAGWLVAEQVAGLAVEYLAEAGQGGEADRPRPAVLQDREVDDGDPDSLGQLGQRHAAAGEQVVQADRDRRSCAVRAGAGGIAVWAAFGAGAPGHHTVPLSSSSIAAPRRTMRAKVSSAAPASAGTGTSARSAATGTELICSGGGVTSEPSSRTVASCWIAAARTEPAMMYQPSTRMAVATRTVNGPLRRAVTSSRHSRSNVPPHSRICGITVSEYSRCCPNPGWVAHADSSESGGGS